MAEKESLRTGTIADQDVEILSNLEGAPTVYVDGFQGFMVINGVVKINGYQIVQEIDQSGKLQFKKLFVCRLAFPAESLPGIANWLSQRVKDVSETPPLPSGRGQDETSSDGN